MFIGPQHRRKTYSPKKTHAATSPHERSANLPCLPFSFVPSSRALPSGGSRGCRILRPCLFAWAVFSEHNTWVLFPRTFNKTNTRNKPKLLLNKSNSKDAGRVDGWAQAQAVTVEIVRWKGGQPSGSPSRSAFPLPWPTERRQRRCAR